MRRVVLITGVARGIGRATARAFADAGWRVIGAGRRESESPPEVDRFIYSDVSQSDDMRRLFDEVEARESRLDALVNNAAMQICKPLLETTTEEWDLTMATNVRSVFLALQFAYPLLKRQRGAVVNVGSVHAVATSTNIAAYAASKGGLLALTRAAALELGRDGIRVNAVLPGAVDTDMLRCGLLRGHACSDDIEVLIREMGARHVMGRVGQPAEIGEVILFLADGDRSSFVTGQALVADGGATARLSTEE